MKRINSVFRGTAKFSEEIINKNLMTQLNVNPLLMLSIMYFAVVLNTPMRIIQSFHVSEKPDKVIKFQNGQRKQF